MGNQGHEPNDTTDELLDETAGARRTYTELEAADLGAHRAPDPYLQVAVPRVPWSHSVTGVARDASASKLPDALDRLLELFGSSSFAANVEPAPASSR